MVLANVVLVRGQPCHEHLANHLHRQRLHLVRLNPQHRGHLGEKRAFLFRRTGFQPVIV